MEFPDGYIMRDSVIWNDLDHRGSVFRGYRIAIPDLRGVGAEVLVDWKRSMRQFLHGLQQDARIQISWRVDSDYRATLDAYDAVTERCEHEWPKLIRSKRSALLRDRMRHRALRNEQSYIYIGKQLSEEPPLDLRGTKLQKHYERVLSETLTQIDLSAESLSAAISGQAGRLERMSDAELTRELSWALNPSRREQWDRASEQEHNPYLSIQQMVCHGEFVPYRSGTSPYRFVQDGHWHGILVARWDQLPESTYPFILAPLLSLPFLDYRVTLNLFPMDRRKVINEKEGLLRRLRGEIASEGRQAASSAYSRLAARIDALTTGAIKPFLAEMVVHWNAESESDLIAREALVKDAFHRMGMGFYDVKLVETLGYLWTHTWPSYMPATQTQYYGYAQDDWLADLSPISSSYLGRRGEPEALYDGSNANVVAISTFVDNTPQLALMTGATRAGKSAFVCDFLTQTDPYYDYTVIVEEGLSHGILTQLMGSTPIILREGSPYIWNYLSTGGLPLSSFTLAMSGLLCAAMCGLSTDVEKMQIRAARIRKYINALYRDIAEDWKIEHSDQEIADLARIGVAADLWRERHMPPSSTWDEGYLEFVAELNDGKPAAQEILDDVTDQQITDAIGHPARKWIYQHMVYTKLSEEEQPTHWQLVQLLRQPLPEHSEIRREIKDYHDMLWDWGRYGSHGALFDGASNVDLHSRYAHFELGYIPEAQKDFRAIAGMVIANYVRQRILTLPRGKRKRVILEEAARILNIPGGETLISEFYAQLSKFSCWIVSIVQQYARFRDSAIAPIMIDNASQFYLLRCNDKEDIDHLGDRIGLPDATRYQIARYPKPQDLPPGRKFAALTYYHRDVLVPAIGTVENRVCPEMLYASSSTGIDFDERSRALRRYDSVLDGVVKESNKLKGSADPAEGEKDEQAEAGERETLDSDPAALVRT